MWKHTSKETPAIIMCKSPLMETDALAIGLQKTREAAVHAGHILAAELAIQENQGVCR